jgi:predicted amidohydrolase YtcJ
MKKRYLTLFLIPIFIFAHRFVKSDFNKENSLLFYNGTIITMEETNSNPEALLVNNGMITELGAYNDLVKLKQAKTQEINLKGKVLMPGFIDPHTHPVISTFAQIMVDLSGFTHSTEKEIWDHLRKTVSETKEGEWLVCKGLDPILVKGLNPPTIQFLDSLTSKHPIIIVSQSLHSYWANSLAFEIAGIHKNSPDPSESSYYEKDENGELTGFIAEQLAFNPFKEALLAAFGTDKIVEATNDVLKDYAQNGNTTISSLGFSSDDPNVLMLFEHLSTGNPSFFNQLLALVGILPKRSPMVRNFVFIREDAINLLPESLENGDDFFKILGVKMWYDGSPYTGSMYMKENYLETELTKNGFHIPPNYRGERLIEKDSLTHKIKKYQDQGWQIAIHTQGDLAIREVMECFEQVNETNDNSDFRHRLEHCLLLDSISINKMKNLGVHPSFHINHLWYYGQALRDEIIGEEKAQSILPIQQAIDNELITTLHADQPMFESNPFSLMHTAINRQTREGDTLGINQSISVENALKAMTINAAYQIKMEDKIGSIKKGKYADLVLLNQNPYLIDPKKIKDIQVEQTYINGLLVYEKAE